MPDIKRIGSGEACAIDVAKLRDSMTGKQFKLAEAVLSGKRPWEAGQIAGYASESATSHALKNVKVTQYLDVMRGKAQKKAIMTREDVLRELAEIAKGEHTDEGRRDSSGRVSAMREISRICGYYEPEKQEVALSGGVMLVPAAPATAEEWEQATIEQQAALIAQHRAEG